MHEIPAFQCLEQNQESLGTNTDWFIARVIWKILNLFYGDDGFVNQIGISMLLRFIQVVKILIWPFEGVASTAHFSRNYDWSFDSLIFKNSSFNKIIWLTYYLNIKPDKLITQTLASTNLMNPKFRSLNTLPLKFNILTSNSIITIYHHTIQIIQIQNMNNNIMS